MCESQNDYVFVDFQILHNLQNKQLMLFIHLREAVVCPISRISFNSLMSLIKHTEIHVLPVVKLILNVWRQCQK